jgi:tetratricopeptide (TPR) repeat protein
MDEKIRREAKSIIEHAKNIESRYLPKSLVLQEYEKGIKLFLTLSNPCSTDFKEIAAAYNDIAIIYFNKKENAKAAECYHASIESLQKTDLSDDTYRIITGRYIDLSDACNELQNYNAANVATSNAIIAFGRINRKNVQELAIGDASHPENLQKFRDFYEKKSSTSSYLGSTVFKNHGQLLYQGQQEMAESELFSGFENISIRETDASIDNMLQQLSVSQVQASPQVTQTFKPVFISQLPSATDYRQTAEKFLRMAKDYNKNGLIRETIQTYEQAIGALNKIPERNERDEQIIQELIKQIRLLKTKPIHSSKSSSSAPLAGFFAHSILVPDPIKSTSEDMMDDNEVNGIYS